MSILDNEGHDPQGFGNTPSRSELNELRARLDAFRNVDDLDWKHLLSWIPDSGHGQFWKSVFAEFRHASKRNVDR